MSDSSRRSAPLGQVILRYGVRAAAWIIGVVLILVGVINYPIAQMEAMTQIIIGALVTPRTRRELRDFCGIIAETDRE